MAVLDGFEACAGPRGVRPLNTVSLMNAPSSVRRVGNFQ